MDQTYADLRQVLSIFLNLFEIHEKTIKSLKFMQFQADLTTVLKLGVTAVEFSLGLQYTLFDEIENLIRGIANWYLSCSLAVSS